jgi:hypothetical protein
MKCGLAYGGQMYPSIQLEAPVRGSSKQGGHLHGILNATRMSSPSLDGTSIGGALWVLK